LGNVLTKQVFRFLIGIRISDTQSGLRAFPRSIVPHLIKLYGEKYEYETNVLIYAKKFGLRICEVPIETIYAKNNKLSHFNPFLDSILIYFLFLKFLFSSVSAGLVDFVIFVAAYKISRSILFGIITARVISSLVNFFANKELVFRDKGKISAKVFKYYLLAVILMSISYTSIVLMHTAFGMNVIIAKILVEIMLFLVSFSVQRDIIFKNKI